MIRTSKINPPKFKYQRPKIRKFYIWQDKFIKFDEPWASSHNMEHYAWRWICTLCDPPSYGCRTKKGAWLAIVTTSLPRHMFVRRQHHEHVRRQDLERSRSHPS